MAKAKAKNNGPVFEWKPKHGKDDDSFYEAYVITSEEGGEEYSDRLGVLYRQEAYGKVPESWRWHEVRTSDILPYVNYINFPTKEVATNFLYFFLLRTKAYCDEHPLPKSVEGYLVDRAEFLRKEEQKLLGDFLQIRSERYRLKKFAEENRIQEVEWRTDDADSEAVVRKLLDFEVFVKQEKRDVPLFSETALYNLIGKEDARTVRSLLKSVITCVAPNMAYEF